MAKLIFEAQGSNYDEYARVYRLDTDGLKEKLTALHLRVYDDGQHYLSVDPLCLSVYKGEENSLINNMLEDEEIANCDGFVHQEKVFGLTDEMFKPSHMVDVIIGYKEGQVYAKFVSEGELDRDDNPTWGFSPEIGVEEFIGKVDKPLMVLVRADSLNASPSYESPVIADLKAYIDKKFAAVHRNIHSGDKVAKILVDLVEKVNTLQDQYEWRCPVCEETCVSNAKWSQENGTPVCTNEECEEESCDMEAYNFVLFETPEWIAAEEFVLRIKRVKEEK